MKKSYILIGAAFVAMNVFAKSSTPAGWTDDFDAAFRQAAIEKKLVLVDFSGSDWCCWCQRLDKEVFSKEAFLTAATNKYVCVMIDSPSDESVLSEKAKGQNKALVKKYRIDGFPTVLVMDATGKVLFKTGYQPGGAEKYLAHLEQKFKAVPLNPLREKLEKARDAIEDEISELSVKVLNGKQPDPNDPKLREEMIKLTCTEVLPKRLPEFRKVIDEVRATKVSEELEAEKLKLVDSYARIYTGMVETLAVYGKEKSEQK